MHEQHDELVAARDQMQHLVRVIVDIGSDLDLDVMLHRIVNAALELTTARYGALGIRGSDGTLVSFVHTGIDDDTARRLGDLPVGEGLRVDDLSAYPQAAGLHAHDCRAVNRFLNHSEHHAPGFSKKGSRTLR